MQGDATQAKGSRRNKFTFWRERRAGRCEAPRRSRCRTSSRSGNKADTRPAAAPLRAAARRPAGIVARSSHTALGIARRSRLASGPGGLQQNANLFLREPLESAAASMNGFWYRKKRLYCEQVSVAKAA